MPRPAASYETSAFSALVCGPKAASGAPADKSKKPWLPAPPKAFVHAELQAVETKLDAEARQWRGDGTLSHAGSAKTRNHLADDDDDAGQRIAVNARMFDVTSVNDDGW